MAHRTEHQSSRMSEIKNGRLDQYGAGPFERQQFGTAGVEGVKHYTEFVNAGGPFEMVTECCPQILYVLESHARRQAVGPGASFWHLTSGL